MRLAPTVLILGLAGVGAALGSGVAQAAGIDPVAVVRESVVFADLDSLAPPVVTTLEPGRDLGYPSCQRAGTDMIWVRYGPRDALPGPQDVGWTYASALDLHGSLPPC